MIVSDRAWRRIVKKLQSERFLQADEAKAKRINKDSHNWSHRSKYQRDRDRILCTTSLRRLSGKTQIFNPGMGEHYRNRLTHTLQVMQIATTISKHLGLDVDLTEAIALGHDIGHTPFGHVGERTLSYIMNNCDILDNFDIVLDENQKGFKHNLQGLRVLGDIEKKSRDYNGINLTKETLWGITHHTATKWDECSKEGNVEDTSEGRKCFCLLQRDRGKFECKNFDNNIARHSTGFYKYYLDMIPGEDCWSFEAYVVSRADDIAQRHHDIEDGIIAGIFEPINFIKAFEKLFKEKAYYTKEVEENIVKLKKEIKSKDIIELDYLLPMLAGFIVEFYVQYYIISTAKKLDGFIRRCSIKTNKDFHRNKTMIWKAEEDKIEKLMAFDDDFCEKDLELKKILKNRIINSRKAQLMDGKGTYVIRHLFEAYLGTPNQLPDDVVKNIFTESPLFGKNKTFLKEGMKATKYQIGQLRDKLEEIVIENDDIFHACLCRNICDYIASMTDRYALKQYEKLYGSANLF